MPRSGQISTDELSAPIIFLGAPRSGTSIISEIVTRHKDLGFPSHYQNVLKSVTLPNYLRRLFDNRFWRIHGSRKQLNDVNFFNRLAPRHGENYPMWEKIVDDDVDFDRDFLIDRKADESQARRIRQFFSDIVRYQGKARLALKITGPPRLSYLCSIFPDARLVYIKRDPTSIVSSLLRVGFWQKLGRDKLWWTGVYSEEEQALADRHSDDAVWMTAFQVRKIIQVTEEELDRSPNKVMRVDYAEFVERPEQTIARILDFAGLDQDSACFEYFAQNRIYNQDRKSRDLFNEDQLNTLHGFFGDHHS